MSCQQKRKIARKRNEQRNRAQALSPILGTNPLPLTHGFFLFCFRLVFLCFSHFNSFLFSPFAFFFLFICSLVMKLRELRKDLAKETNVFPHSVLNEEKYAGVGPPQTKRFGCPQVRSRPASLPSFFPLPLYFLSPLFAPLFLICLSSLHPSISLFSPCICSSLLSPLSTLLSTSSHLCSLCSAGKCWEI